MEPKIIEIKSFEEFVSTVKSFNRGDWIYRGHGRTGWTIESSLARYLRTHQQSIKESWHDGRELSSIQKFQNAAHGYLPHPPDQDDLLSWLAVMQHFGAPTRLIDFTFSPLIALFFASTDSVIPIGFDEQIEREQLNSKYPAFEVHAIQLTSLASHSKKVRQSEDTPRASDYCIGKSKDQNQCFLGFFEGKWLNPRQIAQQGLFMIPSKTDLRIHDYLHDCKSELNDRRSHWVIFRFPGGRQSYRNMVRRLLAANLTHASLFPGLEGVAKSLSMRWYERRTNYALTEP